MRECLSGRRWRSAVFLFLLTLGALAEAREPIAQAGLTRLDDVMSSYVDDGQLAGSVVLIRHENRGARG